MPIKKITSIQQYFLSCPYKTIEGGSRKNSKNIKKSSNVLVTIHLYGVHMCIQVIRVFFMHMFIPKKIA